MHLYSDSLLIAPFFLLAPVHTLYTHKGHSGPFAGHVNLLENAPKVITEGLKFNFFLGGELHAPRYP